MFKCCSISLVHEFKDWIVVSNVVSSAYITYLNVLLDFGKSFMYITKRSGPIVEPCGTPVVKDRVSEMLSLYVTYCFLFLSSFPLVLEQYRIFHTCVIYLIKCCGLRCQMLLTDLKIY